jgi:hypothetical protein
MKNIDVGGTNMLCIEERLTELELSPYLGLDDSESAGYHFVVDTKTLPRKDVLLFRNSASISEVSLDELPLHEGYALKPAGRSCILFGRKEIEQLFNEHVGAVEIVFLEQDPGKMMVIKHRPYVAHPETHPREFEGKEIVSDKWPYVKQ